MASLPSSPPTARFYLRTLNGIRQRDHRVRALARKVKRALPWLEPADEPVCRAWAQLELLADAAFSELRDSGMLNPTGEPKQLMFAYSRLRQAQLAYERELGMTPAARMAIKANGTRASIDFAAAMLDAETASIDKCG